MSEENKAVVRREIEEMFNHTGDLDATEELYSPDYVGHDRMELRRCSRGASCAAGFTPTSPGWTTTRA